MRFPHVALPLALASLASAPAFAQQAAPDSLASPQAQTSYAIGLTVGTSLRGDGVALDSDAFIRGVKDALAKVEGIGEITVAMTFDPPWTPDRMSEEAKLELNMF